MKKYFFLSVACLFASVAFSQVTPLVIFDGEGLTYNLDGDTKAEVHPWWNVDGVNVEVVTWAGNPDKGATIWRVNENDAWAGGGITLDTDISAYNKISVDISKRVSGEVQVELQDGDARAYLKANYEADGTGAWPTLTFDIPEGWTHLSTLLVAPHNVNTTDNPIDFDADNERHRMSWDNVKAYYDPTMAFSTPTVNTLQVFAQNGKLRIVTNETTNVEIYNVSGVLINKQTVVNKTTIPLNSGIYIVKAGKDAQKIVVK